MDLKKKVLLFKSQPLFQVLMMSTSLTSLPVYMEHFSQFFYIFS